jgi:hypothetical protein
VGGAEGRESPTRPMSTLYDTKGVWNVGPEWPTVTIEPRMTGFLGHRTFCPETGKNPRPTGNELTTLSLAFKALLCACGRDYQLPN